MEQYILQAALEGLTVQQTRITEQMEQVQKLYQDSVLGPPVSKKSMSAWMERIGKPATRRSGRPRKAAAATPTRKISAAGRARIAAAQKKRWAAHRKAKKLAAKKEAK